MVDLSEIINYYNNVYYASLDHHRPLKHYDVYLKYLNLKNKSNQQILDVGCGVGPFTGRALRRNFDVSGLDVSQKAIAQARCLYPSGDFKEGQGESLPWPDHSFNVVVCLGSLEHFLDISASLKEMVRVCKSDAKILIMVPNKHYPYAHGTEQAAMIERLMSLREWKGILSENGLSVISVLPDRWPMHCIRLSKRNPIKFFIALYKKYKIWALPIEKSYQFIFLCDVRQRAGS